MKKTLKPDMNVVYVYFRGEQFKFSSKLSWQPS